MHPLPNLKDYDVSAVSGFLPEGLPDDSLRDPIYAPWETISSNLPSLILTRRVRSVIDDMPIIDTQNLEGDIPQIRRAYSILGFMSHAYIWGIHGAPVDTLPDSLAIPLLALSNFLRIAPLATYAGLCLWNFKQIIPDDKNKWNLDNLTTITTFTGSLDEIWFYLVSVHFELQGANCIDYGLGAIQGVRKNNIQEVTQMLQSLAESIDSLGTLLMKMEEMCDPHVFYYRIRPFLAGWKNMAEVGLKKGVKYGAKGDYLLLSGGSNAQSSLIQALDIFLGVEHFPAGFKPTSNVSAQAGRNSFLNEMRQYMPGNHRDFLTHLEKISNIKRFVLDTKNEELTLAFDGCLAMLKAFRDKHIQIVTRYIVIPSNKSQVSNKTLRNGLSQENKKEQRGTGGTSLMPFLKQCRDETGSGAASKWGQKVLGRGVLTTNQPTKTNQTGYEEPAHW